MLFPICCPFSLLSFSFSFSHLPTLLISMSAGHLPICHIFWPSMGLGSLFLCSSSHMHSLSLCSLLGRTLFTSFSYFLSCSFSNSVNLGFSFCIYGMIQFLSVFFFLSFGAMISKSMLNDCSMITLAKQWVQHVSEDTDAPADSSNI